jgi:D-glycero-D-manno-heptose 1,7-bisphosphate phosphatase
MKRPALFMDRDGTVSEEVGYVNHPSRFRLFPYSAEAIKLLNDNGWLAIVVTNQAGVARGYFSEDVILKVHEQIRHDLENAAAKLDAITIARIIRQSASRRIGWTVIVANQRLD